MLDLSDIQTYEESVSGSEKTLAYVVRRWAAVNPKALQDPHLADFVGRVQASRILTPMAFPSVLRCGGGGGSILDYFGSSAATAATATTATAVTAATATATPAATATVQTIPERLFIYCDGACSANGRRDARAGYGVSVQTAKGEELESLSVPLGPKESHTNQRAELRALYVAFQKAMATVGGADIHTDSKYAIDCLQTWGPGWVARGWKKSDGDDVLHQDLLRPMWDIWKRRGTHIRIFHVSAHTGGTDRHSLGNARADQLACQGRDRA